MNTIAVHVEIGFALYLEQLLDSYNAGTSMEFEHQLRPDTKHAYEETYRYGAIDLLQETLNTGSG